MAKDKSDKEKKKEKKRSKEDGVHKPSKEDKKAKKEKKAAMAAAVEQSDALADAVTATIENGEAENVKVKAARPLGALVPFANPLADEKVAKKVLKNVKKAAANKSLKRGVKEVVKALRKSSAPSSTSSSPPGVVILAADISPMDVISHIPVLCEDHSIPYIYVTSRADLGAAGGTKRPTSVVMVTPTTAAKKGKEGAPENGEKEDWSEVYGGLVKVVEKEGRHVTV